MRAAIIVLIASLMVLTSGEAQEPGVLSVGASIGGLNVDLRALNVILNRFEYALLPENMLLIGGVCHNCLTIGGWQLGSGVFYGWTTSQKGGKQADLVLDLGGIFISYPLWRGQGVLLSSGMFLGPGRTTLSLLHDQSGTFEEALQKPPNILLKRDFLAFQPHFRLSIEATPWLQLELYAGYLWTLGSKWQLGENWVSPPPKDFKGYSLQLLFSFHRPPLRSADP